MKYKGIFYFFLMVFYSINAIGSEINLPKPLNKNDEKLYRKVFQLQTEGKFKESDKLIQNIENNILIGRVKAQKFLHPTGYISKFVELRDWLEKYGDHPSASRIYWLSKRKKPKSSKSAKKPSGGYLSGFGNADFVSLRPRIPSSYSGRSAPSVTRKVAFTIRKYIRRSWPTGALQFLNKKSSRRVLTDAEESQLHWEIANAFFIFNKDYEAITEASKSLVISNGKNDSAWFTAGLANWRRGDLKRARLFFTNLAYLENSRGSIRAAGAYWASRVEFTLGDPSNAIKFLKISSNYSDTFYGKLSIKSLGFNHKINFDLPNISEQFISWLSLQKGGLRALALLQVEEYWHADRELRKLYSLTPEKFHLELMSFSSRYGMPSIAYRLADIQRVETGKKWYGALYPNFIFKNENNIKDKALVMSIIRQESRFDQRGKSPARAQGLMQILPSTAAYIMKDRNYRGKLRHDLLIPEKNIVIGEKYIQHLNREPLINNDIIKLLAAYNGGPGNLNKWLQKVNFDTDPLLLIETLLSRETRNYIKEVLKNYYVYNNKYLYNDDKFEELASGKWIIK
ncbi:lytic transglycosylase domain-containing protein [SAR116 cluster bacterium]|nr:lytic transglycosylase domain-containing protein [SAR116 cluster bacterium]